MSHDIADCIMSRHKGSSCGICYKGWIKSTKKEVGDYDFLPDATPTKEILRITDEGHVILHDINNKLAPKVIGQALEYAGTGTEVDLGFGVQMSTKNFQCNSEGWCKTNGGCLGTVKKIKLVNGNGKTIYDTITYCDRAIDDLRAGYNVTILDEDQKIDDSGEKLSELECTCPSHVLMQGHLDGCNYHGH